MASANKSSNLFKTGCCTNELNLLLPWYVNNSLSLEDKNAFELHMAECGECEHQVLLEKKVQSTVAHQTRVPNTSSTVALNRLFSGIEFDESNSVENNKSAVNTKQKKRFYSAMSNYWLKWIIGAQWAAIMVVCGVFFVNKEPSQNSGQLEPAYRTLSANTDAHNVKAARFRVLFSKDAAEGDIRQLLHSIHGDIIAGPTANGVYSIDVLGVDLESLNYSPSALLAYMRNQSSVVFVELLYSPGVD